MSIFRSYYTTIESVYSHDDVYFSDFNVTRYYDMNGNEIKLNQGKTWVCILRDSVEAESMIISDDPSISSDAIDY